MKKFVIIFLVLLAAIPAAAKYIPETVVVDYEIRGHCYDVLLCCTADRDTTYTITVVDDGRVYRSKDAMLLIKLGDDTALPLHPKHISCDQVIDSMFYNNEGESVFIYRNKMHYDYPIDLDDLNRIFNKGIIKVRIGIHGVSSWAEKTWKRDEWGKAFSKAFGKIQEQLAPNYIPPKKPTIYDNF